MSSEADLQPRELWVPAYSCLSKSRVYSATERVIVSASAVAPPSTCPGSCFGTHVINLVFATCVECKTEKLRSPLVAWQSQREKEKSCLRSPAATEVVWDHPWAQHPPSAGGRAPENLRDRLFPLSFESRMPNHGQKSAKSCCRKLHGATGNF